jgi:hypothetical protein
MIEAAVPTLLVVIAIRLALEETMRENDFRQLSLLPYRYGHECFL